MQTILWLRLQSCQEPIISLISTTVALKAQDKFKPFKPGQLLNFGTWVSRILNFIIFHQLLSVFGVAKPLETNLWDNWCSCSSVTKCWCTSHTTPSPICKCLFFSRYLTCSSTVYLAYWIATDALIWGPHWTHSHPPETGSCGWDFAAHCWCSKIIWIRTAS